MSTPLIAAALIVDPIVLGALVGMALRRVRGQRVGGVVAVVACLVVPTVAAVGLMARFPIVGLWDAAIEGFLFGAGVLWTAHRALAHGGKVALLVSSVVLSLLLVELLSRVFLPPPPGFSTDSGPRPLLVDGLRLDPLDILEMDLVCSVVYGDGYAPMSSLSGALREVVTPQTFSPRPGATRYVLHLGDSLAFGFRLPREQTLTAGLERLEPGVQHINAAIPGTAPDAYLAELKSWIEAHRIDLVVMHVYEGNDLYGLDGLFPCCDWQSLLVYGSAGAILRCARATEPDVSHSGWMRVRHHNPPPYLLSALVGTSAAASHLAAQMLLEPSFGVDQPMSTRLDHLEAILRSARDLLTAHHIPFVVDVVPTRTWLETLSTWDRWAPQIVERAQRAGVPVLDGSAVFRSAVVSGQQLFLEDPQDIHFSAAGHALWANWLHEQLAAAAPP
jgi:hypothetical protein